jgi:large subunit ribosomal protein L4
MAAELLQEHAVVNLKGEQVGTILLYADTFGIKEANEQVVHDAVVLQGANSRQATAKTKKRPEVSGGGKKPWRQKGTGRARAGSSRSPLWVGGGKVFGPDGNQNYTVSQNKKAHALALKTVLSQKAVKGLVVVDTLDVSKVSTKEFVKDLAAIKATGKVLLVVPEGADKLLKSARNIADVRLVKANNVSVYDVLNADNIVVSKDDIKVIEGGLR